jgi:hypothetical protein
MPEDNPLVVGSPYPLLPIWSTVTLKFIEARDVPVVDPPPSGYVFCLMLRPGLDR